MRNLCIFSVAILILPSRSHDRRDWRPGKDQNARLLEIGVGLHTADDLMITLYIKGDDAERCTESFQSSIPITVTGIDASDEYRTCTGAVTTMEYAPMPTEHDGRQWRVTIRHTAGEA